MIDEFADGDLRGERGEAAEVVAVPVRDDEVIEMREAGVVNRVHDAAGVAVGARRDIAGVHEQRFAGGRDEERGVAALDVDDVDVEGFARLRLREGGGRAKGQRGEEQDRGARKPRHSHIHDDLREGAASLPSCLSIGVCGDALAARLRVG